VQDSKGYAFIDALQLGYFAFEDALNNICKHPERCGREFWHENSTARKPRCQQAICSRIAETHRHACGIYF
jgi:hypothetical protein